MYSSGFHLVPLWSSQSPGDFSTGGQVYTWGQDSRGQLGLGKRKLGASSPQHLRSLSAIPLVQVAAGGEQSFALSVSGGVIGWGRNDCGQLGLGDTTGNKEHSLYLSFMRIYSVSVTCASECEFLLYRQTYTNFCSIPEHEEKCSHFLWKGPHCHFDKG